MSMGGVRVLPCASPGQPIDPGPTAPRSVAQACDPWTNDLARLLPELEAVSPATPASDDPQIQKRRLFEAIYSVIRPHDPQTCRIVVLEDFH